MNKKTGSTKNEKWRHPSILVKTTRTNEKKIFKNFTS